MKKYTVKCKFLSPYLQARFSERAQKKLETKSGTRAKIEDNDSWKELLYKDRGGIYIPSKQIRESLVNAGKGVKKKPYGNFKEAVQSYFQVMPMKIYIGKQEPDFINESYPPRKQDGFRVKLLHPGFKESLKFEFQLLIANEEIDKGTIKLILEKAGLEKGIGAWRAGGHGRFEIINFK